jgi:hypothetical protein
MRKRRLTSRTDNRDRFVPIWGACHNLLYWRSGGQKRQNRCVPRLALYSFSFRDPLTGKWIHARHKMQVPELQRAYGAWEIIGAPEIRHVTALSPAQYNPFAAPAPAPAIIAPMLLWMR